MMMSDRGGGGGGERIKGRGRRGDAYIKIEREEYQRMHVRGQDNKKRIFHEYF